MDHSSVKRMHTKFGINYEGPPRTLTKEQYIFRISMMIEEIMEYAESTFEMPETMQDIAKSMDDFRVILGDLKLKPVLKLEDQFDALLDLSVFIQGTCELQGFPYEEGFEEVMAANMEKRLAKSAGESKRGLRFDLIKPPMWESPDLKQFVYPGGVIVLDGPDCAGKTELANSLAARYNGKIIHHTWNEKLEDRFYGYYMESIDEIMRTDQLIIVDRLYLSQRVYREAFRAEREDTWGESMKLIKAVIQDMNAVEIICIPENKEAYLDHFSAIKALREEMYDDMAQVYDGYMHYTLDESYLVYDMFDHWEKVDEYVETIGAKLKW